ncbi:hypothetical protein CXG81DRAFT_12166 [Caulochytrium protostelioides]|uniref:Acetyl-CoA synthetase-like protein n=1 Tax=Caulochytrium protostelioides TaxID=1555241 RepID=A0A4P9X7R3_9FUNG|nr:acetyl-CoA synthetase-like protein [Caulochytrium protostelioides]RKP01294.1 hypothetical protein CXG81DRAFT_12166 [Caulochytrium protostelioides]|eukprot:RKP01294.1 hypothetical protein CXG81DRAFT_12166 [Caulochytrium protostelioides]
MGIGRPTETTAATEIDAVGLITPNTVDVAAVMLSVLRTGNATITPVNPMYTPAEAAHQLHTCNVKALVVHASSIELAREAAKLCGLAEDKILLMPAYGSSKAEEQAVKASGLRFMNDVLVCDEALPIINMTKEQLQSRPAVLCFSSGTSGLSKGVISSHRNIVSNVMQYVTPQDDLRPDDVFTGLLPMFHVYGFIMAIVIAPYLGYTVVSYPRFVLGHFLSSCQHWKVTRMFIAPPIALAIVKSPLLKRHQNQSLRAIVSGAAPLSEHLHQELSRLTGSYVSQGYGLTETSPIIVASYKAKEHAVPGTVGVLLPNHRVRLVDPDTREDVPVGPESRGEVWVSGPNVMAGYLGNPEATAKALEMDAEGQIWFKTGDIAVIDASGFFRIVDRVKELIKVQGFQVAPAELEGLLLEHPGIADCAVIAHQADEGELPRGFIVRAQTPEGEALTAETVQAFVASRVVSYKHLRGGVVFVDSIPKSSAGKILRRLLRDAQNVDALIKGSKM